MDNKKENYLESVKKIQIENSIDDEEDGDMFSKSSKKGQSNSTTPILDTFSKDLTKMAKEGKLDPIVGRLKEVDRVSQILSRRKKNNPILIGDPGCVDGDTVITIRKVSNEIGHEIINI
jgi:ATP-dependent Clp protease ATP-binding subunit ClpC